MRRIQLELQNASSADLISTVAGQYGFWHMGQFAADYKRIVGEFPSETLRNAKTLK